ncbi:Os02g0555250 [Oryza sativa Japonica Group]|uniref:Os02g0555250 protein n=2 Tax=Oryza TaxID=4527 RepID=C7IYU5_ORYSJ|nr:Os02g0555250 [Oryza sativa Japonica Group]|eukprot:NP_001173021.1 Os02g0555250 [Oryza sativa Japonica Group]
MIHATTNRRQYTTPACAPEHVPTRMRISIILLPHSIGQCARLDRTASARRHHHQHQVLWWGRVTHALHDRWGPPPPSGLRRC